MSCAACSTANEPTGPRYVAPRLPAAITAPIPDPYREVATTGDVIARLNATEGALRVCVAQVDAVRQWNEETLQSVAPADNP